MKLGAANINPAVLKQVEQFIKADPQVAGDLIARAKDGDSDSMREIADRSGVSVGDARAVAMAIGLDEVARISSDAKVQNFVASTRQAEFQADQGGRGAGATLAAHGRFGDISTEADTSKLDGLSTAMVLPLLDTMADKGGISGSLTQLNAAELGYMAALVRSAAGLGASPSSIPDDVDPSNVMLGCDVLASLGGFSGASGAVEPEEFATIKNLVAEHAGIDAPDGTTAKDVARMTNMLEYLAYQGGVSGSKAALNGEEMYFMSDLVMGANGYAPMPRAVPSDVDLNNVVDACRTFAGLGGMSGKTGAVEAPEFLAIAALASTFSASRADRAEGLRPDQRQEVGRLLDNVNDLVRDTIAVG